MIIQVFVPKLQDMNVDDMWFQQNGATCHTTRETIQLLHEPFPGRVISRFGDQNMPRSCDLTSLDFFLWSFLKFKVYANKSTIIHVLKEEIERFHSATFMQNGHGKFRQKSAYVPAKPWRPFT
ncbi:hypothetical protein ANTQUA_LOCUS4205 [Anthophora quadrimaculata]